jgi:predicted TIM-barrel fold metal-dependent hydrolase
VNRSDDARRWNRGWHLDLGTVEGRAFERGEMSQEEADRTWTAQGWLTPGKDESNPEGRLAAMDKFGQDIQVISLPSHYYMYWADPEWTIGYARRVNEANAQYCSAAPERLHFWAHAPLQDGVASAKELDHAIGQLGAKGLAMAGDNLGDGKHANDESLFPVWEKLCEYDLPVWVHGYNQSVNWPDPTTEQFGTTAIIGMCHDDTQLFWYLVVGGVLDRFPDLKVVITHGGGMVPYQIGRLENTSAVLGDRKNAKPLREYLQNFWFDPLIESVTMRQAMVEEIGPDHLVYGDNFMGSDGIRENLLDDLELSPEDREKISSINAKRVLKL